MGDLVFGFARGDQRVERARHADLSAAVDRLPRPAPGGTARRLVQVYNGGMMPTSPDHFFLTHSVELDGAETEGGTGTPTADTTQTIPVDVIGSVPLVGDLLIAYAVGGRWVAQGGCSITVHVTCFSADVAGATVTITSGMTTVATGTTDGSGNVVLGIGGAASYTITITAAGDPGYTATRAFACGHTYNFEICGVPCMPCYIPFQNLTLSWTNVISGPGSTTLVYSGNPFAPSWGTGCVDQQIYQLECSGGLIEFLVSYFISGSCPTGQSNFCSNLRVFPFGFVLTSYTCSPLSLTFTVAPGCPEVEAPGYTTFTITL